MPMERKGKMSGVGYGARQLIFKNAEVEYAPSVKLYDSTRPLEEAVEQAPDGVTITGVSSGRLRKLKLVSIEGKEPTRENVVSGAYLLYRPLYLTIQKDADPKVNEFVKYILSPDGQAVTHQSTSSTTRSALAMSSAGVRARKRLSFSQLASGVAATRPSAVTFVPP